MPAPFRKHGDMPTVVEMWSDVDDFRFIESTFPSSVL